MELDLKYCCFGRLLELLSCLRAEGSGSSKSLRMLRNLRQGQSTGAAGGGFQERRRHGMLQRCSAVLCPKMLPYLAIIALGGSMPTRQDRRHPPQHQTYMTRLCTAL